MKNKVVILYRESEAGSKEEWIREAQRIWEARDYETERMPIREELSWESYRPRLQERDVSWLVTVDMAGFAWSTLQEGCVYNLLRAKQIHLLTEDHGQYDEMLRKEYAIHLFFFTDNAKTASGSENLYPLVPQMEYLPGPGDLETAVDRTLAFTRGIA